MRGPRISRPMVSSRALSSTTPARRVTAPSPGTARASLDVDVVDVEISAEALRAYHVEPNLGGGIEKLGVVEAELVREGKGDARPDVCHQLRLAEAPPLYTVLDSMTCSYTESAVPDVSR